MTTHADWHMTHSHSGAPTFMFSPVAKMDYARRLSSQLRDIASSSTQYHVVHRTYSYSAHGTDVRTRLRVCGETGANCGRTVHNPTDSLIKVVDVCEDYCRQRTHYYTNQVDGPQSISLCACRASEYSCALDAITDADDDCNPNTNGRGSVH